MSKKKRVRAKHSSTTHAALHEKSEPAQKGFVSNELTKSMNKNEKIIMGILVGGIVIFLILSVVVLFSRGRERAVGVIPTATIEPSKKVKMIPYPTIPPIINMTVMLHSRIFNPETAEIPHGGFITFINTDHDPITIEPNDVNSSMLDLGTIQPGETKQVTFKIPGTYVYKNKAKPTETGIIIIKE